jgi:hypothetical protein
LDLVHHLNPWRCEPMTYRLGPGRRINRAAKKIPKCVDALTGIWFPLSQEDGL